MGRKNTTEKRWKETLLACEKRVHCSLCLHEYNAAAYIRQWTLRGLINFKKFELMLRPWHGLILHTTTLSKVLEKQICAKTSREAVCELFVHSVHFHLLIVAVHVWCNLTVKFGPHKLCFGAIIALCFIFFFFLNIVTSSQIMEFVIFLSFSNHKNVL